MNESDEYEGLEDVDEFSGGCMHQGCEFPGNWECNKCGQSFCDEHILAVAHQPVQDLCWECLRGMGYDPEVLAVNMATTDEYGQNWLHPDQLRESDEYEGLEDVDEFSSGFCVCGSEIAPNEDTWSCERCGEQICSDCARDGEHEVGVPLCTDCVAERKSFLHWQSLSDSERDESIRKAY
jgi:hypothetical protein